MGAHVDDTMTGGSGAQYDAAVARLQKRFPYQKWRMGSRSFAELSTAKMPPLKNRGLSGRACQELDRYPF